MSERDCLWAPWRMAYVSGDQQEDSTRKPAGECFLCRYRDEQADRENYVVHRGKHCLIVLNRYPYNNGHMLIAPYQHIGTLVELADEVLLECGKLLQWMTELIEYSMSAEGFNIGLNLGKVAGAGLPGHLHWHLVPRWHGDANFMPVIADVKIIPQSLDSLYELLTAEMARRKNPC